MAIRLPRRLKYLVFLAAIGLVIYSSLNRTQTANDPVQEFFEQPIDRVSKTDKLAGKARPDKVQITTNDNAQIPHKLDSEIPVSGPPLQPAVSHPEEGTPISGAASFEDNLDEKAKLLSPVSETQSLDDSYQPKAQIPRFQLGRKEHHPVDKDQMYRLPKESPRQIRQIQTEDPSLTETSAQKKTRLERQGAIKAAFERDWAAYRKYAWMHDELKPVSNGSKDPFGGWGATLVDSLDTLIIMGLDEEYAEASKAVADIDFTSTRAHYIPIFETTIRYLGGLLAAYDLGVAKGKKDDIMLSQAKTLGQVLYGAFDTPNRMPMLKYSYEAQALDESGIGRSEVYGVMSEAGSLSVEFTRLAQLLDDHEGDKMFDAVQKVTDAFEESMDYMLVPGLWPLRLDFSGCKEKIEAPRSSTTPPASSRTTEDEEELDMPSKLEIPKAQDIRAHKRALRTPRTCDKQGIRAPPGTAGQTYSQGGLGDSTYEYFTKQFLLLGGISLADQYKRLYEQSIDATKKWLIFKPLVPGDLGAKDILMTGDVYVEPGTKPKFLPKMQHLTCFVGGMVAMASKVFDRPDELSLAARLTEGCVWAYDSAAGGVAPEVFHMHECKDQACSWQAFLDENERSAKTLEDADNSKPDWSDDEPVDRTPRQGQERLSITDALDLPRNQKRATTQDDQASELTAKNFATSQNTKARVSLKSSAEHTTEPLYFVDTRYILRPEAIESVWYMYRITGDRQWQEKGWKMWLAIDKLTRTDVAHTAVLRSDWPEDPVPQDSLESFWFAETLKYFYLLFSDFETISLDEYVLNTEAHPLRRPQTKK